MSLERLLAKLAASDVTLSTDGEELRVRARKGALDVALRAEIAAVKRQLVDHLLDETVRRLRADVRLDPAIRPPSPARTQPARAVLLTGATGYLGSYILRDLLAHTDCRVFCLLRAPSVEKARERLAEAADRHRVDIPQLDARAIPVVGDLTKPRLGLDAAKYGDLTSGVDAVVHAGGSANWISSYEMLRAVNITSVEEVFRFATTGATKHVTLLSSAGVYAHDRRDVIAEDDEPPCSGKLTNAYFESKWVAEAIAWLARARGIPVSIIRAANIYGDSRTGTPNATDVMSMIIEACARIGVAPKVDFTLNLTPVDVVSRAIASIAVRPRDRVGYHFRHPASLHVTRLWDAFRAAGAPVTIATYSEWVAKLGPFVELATILKDNGGNYFLGAATRWSCDCSNAMAVLDEMGSAYLPNEALLDVYVPAWMKGSASIRRLGARAVVPAASGPRTAAARKSQVVLVTGASSGIGELAVKALARDGHRVYASMRGVRDRNATKASELESWARAEGAMLRVVELDVTNDASVAKAVEEVIGAEGRLDVLVNNAGRMYRGVTEAFSVEDFQAQLDTNLVGVFRVVREVLPHMRRQREGLLVYVGSILGRIVFPCTSLYHASKFGLEGLAEGLRYEVASLGIESAIVEPGPFPTNLYVGSTLAAENERSADYGAVSEVPAKWQAATEALFTEHPELTDLAAVADAITTLVNASHGERPFRTVVGIDLGVRRLNAVSEAVQTEVLELTKMEHLKKVETRER